MLNASRPKLNAQLQIWKREGLISCHNDRILINDLGRLRRKAELPAAPLSPGNSLAHRPPHRLLADTSNQGGSGYGSSNQPGGNETGSDRLFEEAGVPRRLACANARNALRAATAIGPKNGCRAPRSRRCCSCASHRSGYATPGLPVPGPGTRLPGQRAPPDPRGPPHRPRHRPARWPVGRFAAVGSPLERLEQLERLDQVDKAWPRCRANSSSSSSCASSKNCPMPTSPANSASPRRWCASACSCCARG